MFQGNAVRRDAESMLVAVNDRTQLHLRHFSGGERNTTVVLLHDQCSDGGVFFGAGNSLAQKLVLAGFDVWVPDLRGHGRSWPALEAHSDWGLHAAVTEDLPTVLDALRQAAPDKPLFLLGQGSGALLWVSFLARWPVLRDLVRGLVLVGPMLAREPGDWRCDWRWRWRHGWRANRLAKRTGLVPGPALQLGQADESPRFYRELRALLEGAWVDPVDGLDHAAALAALPGFPPTLQLAAAADAPWSGPQAARRLQQLLPPHDGRLYVWPADGGVRLLGPGNALEGGAGVEEVERLVLDWLAAFDG